MSDVFFSQRFNPEFGGSISWLTQVCNNWGTDYKILTHSYPGYPKENFSIPIGCSEIIRDDLLMSDWSIRNLDSLKKYYFAYNHLKKLLKMAVNNIHVSHILPEGLSAIAVKGLSSRTKVIAYVHGEELLAYQSSRELSLLAKCISARIDLFICNSANTKKLLLETIPSISVNKIRVVNPSIEVSKFSQVIEKNKLREKYKIENNAKVLITVGRITKRKNQIAVVNVLNDLTKSIPNLKYLILGDGPEYQSLEKQVNDLELQNKVLFYKNPSDQEKIELIKLADIFVMPTIKIEFDLEGFGIVFIEAAAAGLPSIAGNSGGEAEAVLDKITGLIVDGNDPKSLQDSIIKIISDSEFYNLLSANAVKHATQFDSKILTDKIKQHIHNLYDN